jgi:CBS domain-containing protein
MQNLSSIKAADIMQTDVLTFAPTTPIEEAIRTFEDLHISGAPVVDVYEKLVGMLSAFDVARPEHLKAGRIDAQAPDLAMTEPCDVEGDDGMDSDDVVLSMDDYGPETSERPTVADWMTAEVICVGPEWTLPRVCRLMTKEHIHRVPVVHDHRLKGIISSFDVVRCVGEGVAQRGAKQAPA